MKGEDRSQSLAVAARLFDAEESFEIDMLEDTLLSVKPSRLSISRFSWVENGSTVVGDQSSSRQQPRRMTDRDRTSFLRLEHHFSFQPVPDHVV
ncbi:hypothetical protein [Thiorhodococcus drewsii]|uniref:hypothetical protein n=1 Tax=Thiorhodococcus drewsii TaxID=210408 RepID=UPI0011129E9A|nr:hypothetical protein [Thiorhodococcus drewsii]